MADSELGFAPEAGLTVVFGSARGDRIKGLF